MNWYEKLYRTRIQVDEKGQSVWYPMPRIAPGFIIPKDYPIRRLKTIHIILLALYIHAITNFCFNLSYMFLSGMFYGLLAILFVIFINVFLFRKFKKSPRKYDVDAARADKQNLLKNIPKNEAVKFLVLGVLLTGSGAWNLYLVFDNFKPITFYVLWLIVIIFGLIWVKQGIQGLLRNK